MNVPLEERMRMYLALMQEVLIRFDVVKTVVNTPALPRRIVIEICYLQLRLLCEVIALGCLIAHGDTQQSKRIENTYEADKIINAMERLKPGFYPQPVEVKVVAPGRKTLIGLPNSKHLSKRALITLWRQTGHALHRSPFTKFQKGRPDDRADFLAIQDAGDNVVKLLGTHWISLTPKSGLFVMLKEAGTNLPMAQILDFPATGNKVDVKTFKLV